MKDDLPDHLHPTRDLLLKSVRGQADETPPPAPPGLLDDLEARLGGKRSMENASAAEPSLFEKLSSFFATPAFGLVAALILVLVIAIPMMNKGPETFRGGKTSGPPATQLVLIGSDTQTSDLLLSSKFLDPDAFNIVSDSSLAAKLPNPKILLDFTAKTITTISADGTASPPQALPQDPAELPIAIANALSSLTTDE